MSKILSSFITFTLTVFTASMVMSDGVKNTSSALFAAAARGDFVLVTQIISLDPNLAKSVDADGATVLHYAAVSGNASTINALIAAKININARKKDGVLPAHVAAALGNEDALKSFLAAGADFTSPDVSGRTPLTIAKTHGHIGVVKMLRERGATDTSIKSTSSPAISHQRMSIRNCNLNCIYINMNDPKVKISAAIAQTGIGGRETWASFVQRLKPTAAVNGTFFCKSNSVPIGDIVVSGKQVHFGGMGTALCVTQDNIVRFQSTSRGRHMDWSDFQTVICAGPRLLTAGNVTLNARGEGFKDPHVLGSARRAAVGITNKNALLLVTTTSACSLTRLANIMKDLGCYNAMNLDGGSSIGLHYRGKNIANPSRSLTNVLAVYED